MSTGLDVETGHALMALHGVLEVLGGLLAGTYTCLWAIDYRGATSGVAKVFYRRAGSLLWPLGEESGYVSFLRFLGWVGLAVSMGLVALGTRSLIT